MKTLNISALFLLLSILFYSCNKNESAPEIADQNFSIEENSPDNALVGVVDASDSDDDQVISFEIIDGNENGEFEISSSTGILSVANSAKLDFESTTEFFLEVAVSDNHEKEPLESSASIKINLIDVNEFAPVMEAQTFEIDENPANGFLLGVISATDKDIHQTLKYEITDSEYSSYFSIDSQTGALTIADSSGIDFESTQKIEIEIIASDGQTIPFSVSKTMLINIKNIVEFTDDLVAYYPFSGSADDAGPNSYNAEVYNAQLSADRKGYLQSAYNFDGDGDYMTIPHNEKMNFDALTDNYSISFWVKSGEPLPAGAASGRLLQKWNGILGYAYSYSFQMNNEALVFAIWDRSSADLCRFGNIWDDKWHHIVVTVDGDMDQIKCYLDGNLVDQKPITVSGSTKNELDVVMAVKSANETDALYKGLLDEISFHSRMLSPEEIQINAGK